MITVCLPFRPLSGPGKRMRGPSVPTAAPGKDHHREDSMTTLSRERLLGLCADFSCPGLPLWDELPGIPLYMDQVLILLNGYLYPDSNGVPDSRALTPSMINNYIKFRLFPPSVKKKYYRHHLAALIMVCVLKETVSIGDIPRLLPGLDTAEGIRPCYERFLDVYSNACGDFRVFAAETVREHSGEEADSARTVLRMAITGTLCKALTESAFRAAADEAVQAADKREKPLPHQDHQ